MAISPDKLDRYKDFVVLHSTNNGVYNPESGLGSLLSTLTPDPKPVVLTAMQQGTVYFTLHQLHRDVLTWLENYGVPKNAWPITKFTPWSYCEYRRDQTKQDGSLVEIGAVVKQAHLTSFWGGIRTGYIKTVAGGELADPLLPYVCNFVYQAGQSNIPHQYDSTWRLFGNVCSPNDHRKPLAVFRVVEFLIQNPKPHRALDIQEELKEHAGHGSISLLLNCLGEAGVITYDSPDREIGGRRTRGWSRYGLKDEARLQDLDSLYAEIKRIRKHFTMQTSLKRICEFILQNPMSTLASCELSEKFGIPVTQVSTIFSSLVQTGVLDLRPGFKGGVIKSSASVNDLTKMLYDEVLLPAREIANTLTPPPAKLLESLELTYFLQNYQVERSHMGPLAGDEVRKDILDILNDPNRPMKLSHVAEIYNSGRSERKLGRGSIRRHLNLLVTQGLIRIPKQGYYQLVQ